MCQIRKILHLFLQQIAFKNLVQRNKQKEREQGPPAANTAIHLPFIIVNTSKKTVIDCSISNDKWVLGRKDILPHINSGFFLCSTIIKITACCTLCCNTITRIKTSNWCHSKQSSAWAKQFRFLFHFHCPACLVLKFYWNPFSPLDMLFEASSASN